MTQILGKDIELNAVCYETLKFDEPWTYENYLKTGGYQAWKKILAEKSHQKTSSMN